MVSTADILLDDKLFFDTFIIIADRNGNEIRFTLNPAQEILNGVTSNRKAVVKAGQLGITTFYMAKYFKKVITIKNHTAVVVAHEEFLTTKLLHKAKAIYDRMPIPERQKPRKHHDSTYEMSFPSLNSTFYIGTAGAKVFGRGDTIHSFLASEYAFWPGNPKDILVPTEQRVPLDGEMVIESTPNGEGTEREPNAFFELVQEALEGQGIWTLITLPWWLEPEYRIAIGSSNALPVDIGPIRNYTTEELDLVYKNHWDDFEADERIRWRRRKIASIKSAFWQEFFEDIASCFLSVSEPFYSYEDTERLRNSCYTAPKHFFNAEVWHVPADKEENPVYVISVDPGQGKATRSVALVWRLDLDGFTRVRHEATLAGMYDTTAFPPLVKQLGEYYHNARLIPEANGHGEGFCARITDYDGPLYYRTDVVSGIASKQIGWKTTGATRIGGSGTKMYAITELQSLLQFIESHDVNLVRELRQVKYSGANVVFLGSSDYHDAAMIMAATKGSIPIGTGNGFIGTSGWKW